MKDLESSSIDRKNILNNNEAIQSIYQNIGFIGVLFDGKYRFTKQQVASYYEVDVRTIERVLDEHKQEIEDSGYEVFTGIKLKQLKDAFDDTDMNVGIITEDGDNELIPSKSNRAGILTFKAFLNIGMLLSGSEKAKLLRSAMLDIVIDVLNKKIGGNTKYINQREEEFLPSAIREHNYRKEFTNALDFYVKDNQFKYAQLTDKIYKSIFKEDAKEYRQVLKLNTKDSVRSTMYSEVLDLIASYENGFADFLKKRFELKNEKLSLSEAHLIFNEFAEITSAIYTPLREKARGLMASRDMAFRDALHEKLKDYVQEVSSDDFEKFLGERSKTLEQRLEDNKDVFKRLKDR
jgi:hypothetical protein